MQNDYLDLFAEEGEEAREGFGGGVVGKEGDETGADDGAGGVALGCLEGLAVGDAEAYHAGIAQIHGVNPIEIGLFYGVEFLLCAGGRSRRDHVDKAVGVAVDKPDAFLRGLRGYQHDDAQPVAVSYRFVGLEIVFEREVGDYHAVDAGLGTFSAELLKPEMHYRIEITHQYQWDVDVAADVGELAEQHAERHAVAQRLCSGILNNRTVGHRVAERYADFYHVNAPVGKSADDFGRGIERRRTGAEIQ